MSRADLVPGFPVRHSLSMARRARYGWLGWLLLGAGALLGCGGDDSTVPGEYWLGGQTGSLIPDCGVAPLSKAGLAVPSGDVLAVLYTRGCPEDGTPEVAVTGPDSRPIGVTLEPLDLGVYLVRADQSLSTGEHQVELPDSSSSTIAVGESASPLPTQLGRLSPIEEGLDCEQSRFEWELTPETLAHAPLMRLWLRADGGSEQLWVDYGALQIEMAADSRAILLLPRCGPVSCLDPGVHALELRVELAGESIQPEPLRTSFEVQCPGALSNREMADVESPLACSAAGGGGTTPSSGISLFWISSLAIFSRRLMARKLTR